MDLDLKPIGDCPCGMEILVSEKRFAVAHATPCCREFLSMDLDDYLAYVRRSREIPDEDG